MQRPPHDGGLEEQVVSVVVEDGLVGDHHHLNARNAKNGSKWKRGRNGR
jgi:hypothetical protein